MIVNLAYRVTTAMVGQMIQELISKLSLIISKTLFLRQICQASAWLATTVRQAPTTRSNSSLCQEDIRFKEPTIMIYSVQKALTRTCLTNLSVSLAISDTTVQVRRCIIQIHVLQDTTVTKLILEKLARTQLTVQQAHSLT